MPADRTLVLTAVHEGGHVVAALHHGVVVEAVRLGRAASGHTTFAEPVERWGVPGVAAAIYAAGREAEKLAGSPGCPMPRRSAHRESVQVARRRTETLRRPAQRDEPSAPDDGADLAPGGRHTARG